MGSLVGDGVTEVGVTGTSQKNAGVLGEGSTGVYGRNTVGTGNGIIGASTGGNGVWGHSVDTGIGVLGEGAKGVGVRGFSADFVGVWGESESQPGAGQPGVFGKSPNWQGVHGESTASVGVFGFSTNFVGVWGESNNATQPGIFGKGPGLAGSFQGNVAVDGSMTISGNIELTGQGSDIRLNNADCAEDFDVLGRDKMDAGTVMILGDEGTLCPSEKPYDKRVAGVISGAGHYKPAIVLDGRKSSDNRQPLALMGKVFCKVEADSAPVVVGDLLTTSATPG
jgi:hypothetical protein